MTNLHTITTYYIDEHPDQDAVYQFIRENWHGLGQHYIDEAIESLEACSNYFNADLDYSIGIFPDRGEFISLKLDNDAIANLSGNRLRTYLVNNYPDINESCLFTGVCYDEALLDPFRDFIKKPNDQTLQDLLNDAGHSLLKDIHSEGEYIYSDEGLKELCQINDYEFLETGELYL